MRRRLYVPELVIESIQAHVKSAIARARDGFLSAAEDEDTLTGHLGGLLQIPRQRVRISSDEIPGDWSWTIKYTKFRGRGPNATESYLGADGVFELGLETGGRVEQKALLFQAKIGDQGGRRLVEQALTLSTWREAATVITYSPAAFEAHSVDDVLANRGDLRGSDGTPLDTYLSEQFLPCLVGDDELQYDARKRRLKWRAMNGELVAAKFSMSHRVRIEVEAPTWRQRRPDYREISPDEISNYRMLATEDEILRPAGAAATTPIATRREILALYHPDRYSGLDEAFRSLANRRAQDINAAYDKVPIKRAAPDRSRRRRTDSDRPEEGQPKHGRTAGLD